MRLMSWIIRIASLAVAVWCLAAGSNRVSLSRLPGGATLELGFMIYLPGRANA
jgi:hypothetical protein